MTYKISIYHVEAGAKNCEKEQIGAERISDSSRLMLIDLSLSVVCTHQNLFLSRAGVAEDEGSISPKVSPSDCQVEILAASWA